MVHNLVIFVGSDFLSYYKGSENARNQLRTKRIIMVPCRNKLLPLLTKKTTVRDHIFSLFFAMPWREHEFQIPVFPQFYLLLSRDRNETEG